MKNGQNNFDKKLEKIRAIAPEIFSEGQLNIEKLLAILGENHILNEESYQLSWFGKIDALKEAQRPAVGRLKPFSNQNSLKQNENHLFIEGDNLEVLKLLYPTHFEKIKMIYIDPPYNTGNENFVYTDNFSETKEDYFERLKDNPFFENLKKNHLDSARIHSQWLSMIYTRLLLGRDLLRPDGVIFISIDDSEQANLKLICDEIFGEQNFIANMVRQNKVGSGHDSAHLAVEYDYVLVYAKNKNQVHFHKEKLDVENDKKYRYEDEFVSTRGKFYLRDLDYKGNYSKSMDYPITMPDGTEIYSGNQFGEPNTWRWSKEKLEWGIKNDFIVFKKNKNQWKAYIKQYQYADNEGNPRERKLPFRALTKFLNAAGSKEIKEIFGNAGFFSYPKSTELLKHLIKMVCDEDDIVLDFFAGSSTTGHAVLNLNLEEDTNRKFICVQIPEPLSKNDVARKAGFETLADLSLERLKRVINSLPQTPKIPLVVFKLEMPSKI